MRPIGVSIISFFPTFFKPDGYAKIRSMLDGLGIQLLPLRGLRRKHVQMFNVLSYEGPWNCGSVLDALKRDWLGIKRDYPSLIDIALFGSERICKNRVQMFAKMCPNAVAIDTPWVEGSAVELSPDMYKGNARNWDRQPNGVVLDTGHWRRFKKYEAERELEKLGGLAAVRMVHLKLLTPAQVVSFLVDQGDMNVRLIKEFTSQDPEGRIPLIIETKNQSLGQSDSQKGRNLTYLTARIAEVLS